MAISENRLTRRSRAWWIASAAAAIVFAVFGLCIECFFQMGASLRIVWWIYTLANVAFGINAFRILRQGRLDPRSFGRFVLMIPLACAVIVVVLFVHAWVDPTLQSLLWVVFGVTCLLIDLAWLLWGRIAWAHWAAHEDALRLELLLLDLRDGRSAPPLKPPN